MWLGLPKAIAVKASIEDALPRVVAVREWISSESQW
jgi:hypothetical protein